MSAYLRTMITAVISLTGAVIQEKVGSIFIPTLENLPDQVDGFMTDLACKIAGITATNAVEKVDVEIDINGFDKDALPYNDIMFSTDVENLLDYLYIEEEMDQKIFCFLMSSLQSQQSQ